MDDFISFHVILMLCILAKVSGNNTTDVHNGFAKRVFMNSLSSPDVSFIQPVIDTVVQMVDEIHHELYFFCDFTPQSGTNYFYIVEWSLTSDISLTWQLLTTSPTEYINKGYFRTKTALTESQLRVRGHDHLGIMVVCSVRAATKSSGPYSYPVYSETKFAGIEIVNKSTVYLNHHERVTVNLRLTVPFGCPWFVADCSLDVGLFIPSIEGYCSSRTRNRCAIRISSSEVGVVKQLHVKTEFLHGTAYTGAFTLIMMTVEAFPSHPLFGNYILDPLQIQVLDESTTSAQGVCLIHDGHLSTFDGLKYENALSGTFILYRNNRFGIEVQYKAKMCSYNELCVCGAIVRAGTDVFIHSKCDTNGVWHTDFPSCGDKVLRRSVRKVGSTYNVYLPTGASVVLEKTMQDALWITVRASLDDRDNTDALCGNFDNNVANDLENRPGSTTGSTALSWRVQLDEDLFDMKNYHNLKRWDGTMHMCFCDDSYAGIGYLLDYVTCSPDGSKLCSWADMKKNFIHYDDTCSLYT